MPLDFDEPAKIERDKRLRRALLDLLYLIRGASPSGFSSGSFLVDSINKGLSRDQRVENDRHGISLLRVLEGMNMIDLRKSGLRRDDAVELKNLHCKITADGVALKTELSPPHPLIDDDRVSGEEL